MEYKNTGRMKTSKLHLLFIKSSLNSKNSKNEKR